MGTNDPAAHFAATRPGHDRPFHHRWAMAALCLLVALVYWPGLGGGYVFDDFPNIIANTALHVSGDATGREWLAAMFSSPSSQLQRPLAMLSFAINHGLAGLDPYWMKLTNLGIHLLNAWLVFGLVRCILRIDAGGVSNSEIARRDWIALWIAAAWVLNPINLMAVLYVVQRMESLCHTFVFAGLWLYLAGRMRMLHTGRGWPMLLGGLVGGTALGVMVKESAVLLPLYALALELALLGFASQRSTRDRRIPGLFVLVLLLPALIGLVWLMPQVLGSNAYAGRTFTLDERLMTESRVLVDYLRWTLAPDLTQLGLYHDDYPVSRGLLHPPATLASLLLLSALLAAMAWLRKRRPVMALGLAWFFSAHLLTATVLPLELVFEHRNYFASLGVVLALGDGLLLSLPQRWRRAGAIVAIGLLGLYATITLLRAKDWHDPLRFSMTEAAKHPHSPRATYDLARNLLILTDFQPDSPYIDQAFEALDNAMLAPASTALPESAAITLAARTDRTVDAGWWQSLQHKLGSQPLTPQQTGALATLVACQVHHPCPLPQQQMMASFSSALAQGKNAELLSIYGNYVLNVRKDPGLALQLWRQAAELAPGIVQYQESLARMLIATGQLDEARVTISRIRSMGRLGQHSGLADSLERLAQSRPDPGEPGVQSE